MKTTLLIMAAGIGSRFGTGIKQLATVDNQGHIIMDYSIHDAIEAGFNKIIFIIRRDIEEEFKSVIGDRIERTCAENNVEVDYAYQSLSSIPEPNETTKEQIKDRTKPWGTGQAVLAAKDLISTPFAVINADDYYGKEAYRAMHPKGRRSCGCAEFTDLTGKRFGRLVAQERVTAAEAGKDGNRHWWRCKCDCGKTTFVDGGNLLNGTTKSCGCLREGPKEDLSGRRFGRLVVKGWLPDENRGIVWECQCDCGGTCYSRRSFLLNGRSISCGCFMQKLAPKVVQYARVNSGAIEGTNVKLIQGALEGKQYSSNTSGVRGVRQDKRTGHWVASISFKKNKIYLGMFTDKEDAVKVRKKAEGVLFGEFLEYYESELKENHEAEMEELKQKYLKEIREYAARLKEAKDESND